MQAAADEIAGRDLLPVLEIDGALPLERIAREGLPLLEQLEPFGLGNPEPMFCAANVRAQGIRPMGSTGAHLQLSLKDGRTAWRAVGFNLAERLAEFRAALDVVVSLEQEWWQGNRTVRLNVRDVRPASVGTAPVV
jgi:single-stranded-DNA-specific exonuclease